MNENNMLIHANETLERTQKDKKEIYLLLKNHHKNYQEIITNVALEYLQQKNPTNEFFNVFHDGQITRFWINFRLDGLIYDTTDNVFHIVIFNYNLNEDGLIEIDETLKKFREFIQMEKPQDRRILMRWGNFFDDECGIVPNGNKDGITISVFLGFENVLSKNIVSMAGEKMFTVIGPDEYHYCVYTSTTF
jgi:hypothetical protein